MIKKEEEDVFKYIKSYIIISINTFVNKIYHASYYLSIKFRTLCLGHDGACKCTHYRDLWVW